MGVVAILLIALAGWLVWTGRLQRMTAKDGMALGIAIVGAVMAAKGKPLIGALPMLGSAAYVAWRIRARPIKDRSVGDRPMGEPAKPAADSGIADARALLGLPVDADVDAIRSAHRRLIATVHPDRGGTEALAAKINAARDLLLRHHEETKGSHT